MTISLRELSDAPPGWRQDGRRARLRRRQRIVALEMTRRAVEARPGGGVPAGDAQQRQRYRERHEEERQEPYEPARPQL